MKRITITKNEYYKNDKRKFKKGEREALDICMQMISSLDDLIDRILKENKKNT